MLLLVFFLLGVFLLYIYRERCARQRKFILLVVKTERETEKKFTNFATTQIKSLWFLVRVFAGRTEITPRREFIFRAVAPKIRSRVSFSYLVLDFFLFLVGHFLLARCVM